MSKPAPLHISIPEPCSQNWEEMSAAEKGRFCSHCKKTVIDFSYLSDTELYQYFQTNKDVACGRFNTHQLNTPVLPAKRHNSYWQRLYKPVAALLAFLSMRYSTAAMDKKQLPTTISPYAKKTTIPAPDEKIIISGTVRNEEGTVLENVEIRLNNIEVSRTDKKGHYSFEFKIDPKAKSYILSAVFPGLTNVVRNYHPAMLSTTYDFVLEDPKQVDWKTMGVIATYNFDTATFCFKKNATEITNEMASVLSDVATRMRNRPDVNVKIVAYTRNSPEQPTGKKRQDIIKRVLVEEHGISEERLQLVTEPKSATKKDTVEIVDAKRE
jgi:outer membrane protein OmpA-like peptidoglycan-associated protein